MKRALPFYVTLIALTGLLQAQPGVSWSTVTGGGGVSCSGGTLLNGSLGTFSGSVATKDNAVQVKSGFWSGVPTTLFSVLPFLNLELVDNSTVRLSWPVTATGFSLQKATTLSPPDWLVLELRPVQQSDKWQATDSAAGIGFYRLRKE